jgi:soluble lytic murein transglycosylase-like protein
VGSLAICALIAFHSPVFYQSKIPEAAIEIERIDHKEEQKNISGLFLKVREKAEDPVMGYYRNLEYREWVIDFFASICSNREIARAILDNADEFDVPAALAFALSWEESNFNPRAINKRNRDGSIDRGLFQLNNRSFPQLETNDFFDVSVNARYGIGHLRHCLNSGGSEISALAMYNAGTGRVKNTGAPKVTLDYISRILENQSKIESRFHAMLIKEEENRLVEELPDDIDIQQSNSKVWFNALRLAAGTYFSLTFSSASPL